MLLSDRAQPSLRRRSDATLDARVGSHVANRLTQAAARLSRKPLQSAQTRMLQAAAAAGWCSSSLLWIFSLSILPPAPSRLRLVSLASKSPPLELLLRCSTSSGFASSAGKKRRRERQRSSGALSKVLRRPLRRSCDRQVPERGIELQVALNGPNRPCAGQPT